MFTAQNVKEFIVATGLSETYPDIPEALYDELDDVLNRSGLELPDDTQEIKGVIRRVIDTRNRGE